MATSSISSSPSLTFELDPTVPSSSPTSPRVGTLAFSRPSDGTTFRIPTPGLILNLEKGVVPSLSPDNLVRSDVPKIKHVSLDTFLFLPKPLGELLSTSPSPAPLAQHLLHPRTSTILSLSFLNPTSHLVPLASQNNALTAISQKGYHSASPSEYYTSALALKPDILWAAADTRSGLQGGNHPGGKDVPNPAKQETRGAMRTVQWIEELVEAVKREESEGRNRPVLWTDLVGGVVPTTRSTFSSRLVETGLETQLSGYTLPLPSLRTRILSLPNPPSRLGVSSHPLPNSTDFLAQLIPLAQASFTPLPTNKPRLASAALSPHELLALVGDAGVDLFDGTMAYEATEMGVAFDFVFPVPAEWGDAPGPKREVGISLYDTKFELDFTPLVPKKSLHDPHRTPSLATDPTRVENPLVHCSVSAQHPPRGEGETEEPFTKAYIHHLLMAHELLAGTLLQSHNLAHLSTFLSTIRRMLLRPDGQDIFARERARFETFYDGVMGVLLEARKGREGVKKERGKGSMGTDRSGGGKKDATAGGSLELEV